MSSPIFDDMSLADLVGSGIQNNGNNPVYNGILNQASDLILKATGRWEKSFTYSFLNAGISSILSGWY